MNTTDKLVKKDYIWNTAAGLLNAGEAVFMSMVVTRVTGLSDAGILTIAFAIGNLMMTIGKFGTRNFQVTDAKQQYDFPIYLRTRFFTIFIMLLATFGYLFYAGASLGYSQYKMESILLICLIYAVESLEDVFWGYYQQRNRLAVGAQMFCARWVAILVLFLVGLLTTRSLTTALLLSFLVSVLVFIIMLRCTYPHVCAEQDRKIRFFGDRAERSAAGRLLLSVSPIFGSSFLSYYVSNAPKYAIDACMSDEIQACYGFVAMPVFVIGLLNNFIYQPTLVHMAEEWRDGKKEQLTSRIKKQTLIIGGISLICLAGAWLLGIPVLSVLYHTDLTDYKRELLILLAAGGFLAVSGYMGVVLTIMRCQKEMLVSYSVIAVIAFVGLKSIVSQYGTMGAAIFYMILIALLCVIYLCFMIRQMKTGEGGGRLC